MYDIDIQEGKIFLIINITDYGKTIIGNVQDYQRRVYEKEISPKESIVWAMQTGILPGPDLGDMGCRHW